MTLAIIPAVLILVYVVRSELARNDLHNRIDRVVHHRPNGCLSVPTSESEWDHLFGRAS